VLIAQFVNKQAGIMESLDFVVVGAGKELLADSFHTSRGGDEKAAHAT
jgi:hypothetical protein